MLRYTKGFVSAHQRADHFQKHGTDFGLRTEDEYETAADEFMGGPRGPKTHECVVPKGSSRAGRVVRYDEGTDQFGILSPEGYILTYYRPAPLFGTKLDYFKRQCL